MWLPLAYFSVMEALQAVTYVKFDECSNSTNHFLTYSGYIHIAFQPFFANMVAMHFIPQNVKRQPFYIPALARAAER